MWPLIRKDLLRRLRSPLSTLVMIAFPLFMSAAVGSISGGPSGDAGFPRIHILIENRDEGGFLADSLIGMLSQEDGQQFLDVELVGAEGAGRMEEGDASALVILPENFTKDVLNRVPTEILILRNPAEGIKPEIVAQGGQVVATYLDQGARLLGSDLGDIQAMIDSEEVPAGAKVGAIAASITERLVAVQDYLFPPLVGIGSEKQVAAEDESDGGLQVFGYILIMTTVMALLFTASRSIGDLYEEKNSGMLRRQAASPLPVSRIILAKFLFSVVLGVIVMVLLGLIGVLMDWIDPPADPFAVLLLGVTFNLAACGALALLTGLVSNERQSAIFSWIVIMGMSAMGGSMVPVNQMPAAMRAAAPFTLNYWAIEGLTDALYDGSSTMQLLQPIGILLAAGLVCALIANALLVRRFREMS